MGDLQCRQTHSARTGGAAPGLETGSARKAAIRIEMVDGHGPFAIYGCETCSLLDLAGMQHVLRSPAGGAPLNIALSSRSSPSALKIECQHDAGQIRGAQPLTTHLGQIRENPDGRAQDVAGMTNPDQCLTPGPNAPQNRQSVSGRQPRTLHLSADFAS